MDILKNEILAVMDIVDVAVGIDKFTYPMYVNAKRPEGNYAAVRCASSKNPGFDSQRVVSNPDDSDCLLFITEGIRILTFDVLFSREGDEVVKFDNAFYRPDVHAVMAKHKFAALNKYPTELKNISLETNWEIRTGITVEFNVIRKDISKVDEMTNAKVSGIFVDDNKINVGI
ncbi:MAG: hypothetical protein EKE20_14710 [Candidatus Symbiopectobacterium sp. Dall1.0]|nr:hypothetical protein [Candidatus Symbiopectobacterium sp. Dall1.0]